MLPIRASSGGGLVPYWEVAKALGMFQLQHSGYVIHSDDCGIIEVLEDDHVWEFTFEGRVWRVQQIYGIIHFDYIRQGVSV